MSHTPRQRKRQEMPTGATRRKYRGAIRDDAAKIVEEAQSVISFAPGEAATEAELDFKLGFNYFAYHRKKGYCVIRINDYDELYVFGIMIDPLESVHEVEKYKRVQFVRDHCSFVLKNGDTPGPTAEEVERELAKLRH